MPHKDPEAKKAYHREYNRRNYPGYYQANADRIRERSRKSTLRRVDAAREKCLDAYGRTCACCGLDEVVFLTFDHVNNDGAAHRRELYGPAKDGGRPRGGTYTFLRWLINNGFPDSIQLLCANCQLGKVRNGGACPHQR